MNDEIVLIDQSFVGKELIITSHINLAVTDTRVDNVQPIREGKYSYIDLVINISNLPGIGDINCRLVCTDGDKRTELEIPNGYINKEACRLSLNNSIVEKLILSMESDFGGLIDTRIYCSYKIIQEN